MANHHFLNEITNHIGDSSVLVKAILNLVSVYGNAEVEWYVRPDQQQFLEANSSVFVELNHADLAARLKNRVVQLSQNGAAGSIFHIFSYDGFVLGAATALNGPDLCVVGHHLAELARAVSRNRPFFAERKHSPGVRAQAGSTLPITLSSA
ncbi:MAG: hypothetical protein EXQ47_08165 [Bryobacterales bacterium]|nr:hypothetical protein [Bryobacterales bacterium]